MYNNSKEVALLEKYPLVSELPLEVNEYINNYSTYVHYRVIAAVNLEESSAKVTITDYSGGNYGRALSKISSLGFNLEDYDITYVDQSSENYWPRVTKY